MRRQGKSSYNTRQATARERAFRALSDIRGGASVSEAARANGVTVRTLKRYVGSALVQDRPGGIVRVRKDDHLTRHLQIPGPNGPIVIEVHSFKAASDVARYKAALNRFLRGDRDALAPWRGKKIAGVEIITDSPTLISQADRGLLPYALYAFTGSNK
jgi:hypothetical protein